MEKITLLILSVFVFAGCNASQMSFVRGAVDGVRENRVQRHLQQDSVGGTKKQFLTITQELETCGDRTNLYISKNFSDALWLTEDLNTYTMQSYLDERRISGEKERIGIISALDFEERCVRPILLDLDALAPLGSELSATITIAHTEYILLMADYVRGRSTRGDVRSSMKKIISSLEAEAQNIGAEYARMYSDAIEKRQVQVHQQKVVDLLRDIQFKTYYLTDNFRPYYCALSANRYAPSCN